ncbi:MAG: hypothetical protein ACYCS3_07485 [Acidithiobacillus sp.]
MLKKKPVPVQVAMAPPPHPEEIVMPFSLTRLLRTAWAQPARAA